MTAPFYFAPSLVGDAIVQLSKEERAAHPLPRPKCSFLQSAPTCSRLFREERRILHQSASEHKKKEIPSMASDSSQPVSLISDWLSHPIERGGGKDGKRIVRQTNKQSTVSIAPSASILCQSLLPSLASPEQPIIYIPFSLFLFWLRFGLLASFISFVLQYHSPRYSIPPTKPVACSALPKVVSNMHGSGSHASSPASDGSTSPTMTDIYVHNGMQQGLVTGSRPFHAHDAACRTCRTQHAACSPCSSCIP